MRYCTATRRPAGVLEWSDTGRMAGHLPTLDETEESFSNDERFTEAERERIAAERKLQEETSR